MSTMSAYQSQSHDMYHENSTARSPGSQRHQQPLHRQPSRQFDAYGPMPTGMYEDPMARYDTNRMDRLNPNPPAVHGNTYGYDMSASQAVWNGNGFGGAHTLGGIGATGRMKPNGRGRTGIPTVSLLMGNVVVFRGLLLIDILFKDMARSPTWYARTIRRTWTRTTSTGSTDAAREHFFGGR